MVAHDSYSESHTGTTGSASEASFSWTHTPTGTPKGVCVFVGTVAAAAPEDTGVTYGGVAMQRLDPVGLDTVGELAFVRAYFLGAGVLTGAQTVVVSRANTATVMYAACVAVTADGDTWVPPSWVTFSNDVAYTEKEVTDGSLGSGSQRYAFGFSGANDITTVAMGDNTTVLGSIDFGNFGFTCGHETTPGLGSRPVGFVYSADDTAGIYLAIADRPTNAVLHEASSQSHAGTGESVSEASFSWAHPGFAPKGVFVAVVTRSASAAPDTGVTYGGETLALLPDLTAVDTGGEPSTLHVYFLGAGIPTGEQTVVVSRTNNALPMWAWAVTVTGPRNTEVNTASAMALEGDGALSEQGVWSHRPSLAQRYAMGYVGHSPPTTAGPNSTLLQRHDFTLSGGGLVCEKGPGIAARSVGILNALSDDRAVSHFAIGLVTGLVQSGQAGNSSAGATSVSLPGPATAKNLLVSVAGVGTVDASDVTHPTDFVVLGYHNNDFGQGRSISVAYKIATGGEEAYSGLSSGAWNLIEVEGYEGVPLGWEAASYQNDITPPVPALTGLQGPGLVLVARMKQPATPNPGPESCSGFGLASDTGYAGLGSRFRCTTWMVTAESLASSYGGFDLSGASDGSEDGTIAIFGFAAVTGTPRRLIGSPL